MKPLFELGRVVQTFSVAERRKADARFDFFCDKALHLHVAGNWGDVSREDQSSNQAALRSGERLFSAYKLDPIDGPKIWIITEADRSATTILFPKEY